MWRPAGFPGDHGRADSWICTALMTVLRGTIVASVISSSQARQAGGVLPCRPSDERIGTSASGWALLFHHPCSPSCSTDDGRRRRGRAPASHPEGPSPIQYTASVLTKKSKYGLKAVLYLAGQVERGPISVAEIAEHERIPRKFLEAILLDLKRHGLLHSRKGKGGGYVLMKTPAEITLGRIIRTLDGPLALIPCVSQTAYARCEECADEESCGVRIAMKDVRDATAQILDHTTLSALNARCRPEKPRRRRRSAAP